MLRTIKQNFCVYIEYEVIWQSVKSLKRNKIQKGIVHVCGMRCISTKHNVIGTVLEQLYKKIPVRFVQIATSALKIYMYFLVGYDEIIYFIHRLILSWNQYVRSNLNSCLIKKPTTCPESGPIRRRTCDFSIARQAR